MLTTQHDYHIHTRLSTCCADGRMSMDNILPALYAAGIREACVTDHLWDRSMPGADAWYAPQDVDHVSRTLPFPEAPEGMAVYFGCETEFCGGRKIGISPQSYDAFDFIIVPFNHLHNNFSRPVDVVTAEQVAALYMDHFEDLLEMPLPWHKVGIAHLTCHLTFPNENLYRVFDLLEEDRLYAIFRSLKASGTGIELNAGCFKPGWRAHEESFLRVYRFAKEAGCSFYCGSDAHSLDALTRVPEWLPEAIDLLDLTEADRYRIPGPPRREG